jgi:site-specific DNA recombinase
MTTTTSTTRFAFYGRVSTEDQQDPQASRQWQLSRATALIEPAGGEVVAEFFDVGQSRSLPWKRRPEAARLLDVLKLKDRGFDAVVIGEPHRAFYGPQFSLTFPVLTHHQCALWVPEVGGAVDPGSEAHDIVMSLFGGLSKGERMRIKTRVRSAMASQAATEGRYLGGRPPFGYRLGDAGAHPNPGKAAVGQRLHRLEPDPVASPTVRRIYSDYLGGMGIYAIAEGLTRDGIPSPSAHDPARNRHRDTRAWSKHAVRAILLNPRYVGREVWNKQRRDEVLVDVEDVGLGHKTTLRWNDPSEWIWSSEEVHEPLVSSEDFAAVQAQMAVHAHRHTTRKPRAARRPYVLAGLVWCAACGRRMQGNYNHDAAHYRCRYPAEYALANKVDHPKTAYVRESAITGELDRWLTRLFDPENIAEAVKQMASAGDVDEAREARAVAARRALADCDDRLEKYRRALESGADPVVVAGWTTEVKADRLAAEAELAACAPPAQLTADELGRMLTEELGNVGDVLADEDPATRTALYASLGVTITYDPSNRLVTAEARPQIACALARVGGGT